MDAIAYWLGVAVLVGSVFVVFILFLNAMINSNSDSNSNSSSLEAETNRPGTQPTVRPFGETLFELLGPPSRTEITTTPPGTPSEELRKDSFTRLPSTASE